MKLEGIMLSEKVKDKYPIILLLCGIWKNKHIKTENRLAVARGRGWEVGKIYEGGQKYKLPVINSKGYNTQHDDCI